MDRIARIEITIGACRIFMVRSYHKSQSPSEGVTVAPCSIIHLCGKLASNFICALYLGRPMTRRYAGALD